MQVVHERYSLPATVAVKVVRMVSLTLELDMTFLNDGAANTTNTACDTHNTIRFIS